MKNIIALRQEIAQMRLNDLAKEYGNKSQRVAGYKNRMGELLEETNQKNWQVSQKVKKLAY